MAFEIRYTVNRGSITVEFGLKLSRRFGLNLARQKAVFAQSSYM